jgi:hypothetical protein
MAVLNTAQKAVISRAIELMDGNYEKPLDGKIAEDLSTIHAALGATSQIKFLEDLRDKPFTVLTQAVKSVYLSPGFTVGPALDRIIELLEGAHDRPLDARIIWMFGKIYLGPTFAPIVREENFRDKPYSTFLNLILAVNGTVAATGEFPIFS